MDIGYMYVCIIAGNRYMYILSHAFKFLPLKIYPHQSLLFSSLLFWQSLNSATPLNPTDELREPLPLQRRRGSDRSIDRSSELVGHGVFQDHPSLSHPLPQKQDAISSSSPAAVCASPSSSPSSPYSTRKTLQPNWFHPSLV